MEGETVRLCQLQVNINCEGCEKKVKKVLEKIKGVIQVSVDAETGTVKVLGYADPATLLKKLKRAGKIAELLATERVDIGGENSEDSGDSEDEYSCSKTTTSTSAASSSSRRHYLHSPPPYWPPPTTYEPSPAPALPPAANSFEHYFSDENAANGCFIM